jgi:hypothetical protein
MIPTYDDSMENILASWKVTPPDAQFADRIAGRALMYPQRQNLPALFWRYLVEVTHDLFGNSYDPMTHTSNWRLAGAMAAIVIGFASGYMLEMPSTGADTQDTADVFELDEAEPVGII